MAKFRMISEQRLHGSVQGCHRHLSQACGGPMFFAVYPSPQVPQQACSFIENDSRDRAEALELP